MASSTMKSCFCLFVVAFCLSLNVEAREGKLFFSTFEPYGTHVEEGPSPSPAPAVSPAEGPSPATAPINPTRVGGGLRDGHFGPGSGMIPQTQESWPTTTTTTTSTSDDDFDKLLNKFDGEKTNDKTDKLEEENYNTDRQSDNLEKENYQGEGYEKRNKYYNSRVQTRSKEYYYDDNTYNGHTNHEYNRYSPRSSSSNNNYRSNNNYNEDMMREGDKEEEEEEEEEEERQGMSDTRFMENGRYFYDVKGENYENVPSEYGVEGEGYEKNDSERAHQKYPNEFDSMEEYYQSLERPRQNFQP